MKLHMLFALLVSMLCGQMATAHFEAAYLPVSTVRQAHAVQVEMFTFDKKGNAVFLGYEHQYLLPCETEQDLVEQIEGVGFVDIKVDPKLETFTYVTVTDNTSRVIFEGNPSFKMEKNDRKKWVQPWLRLDLHVVWDGPIKTGPSDYPLTKKTFGKKVTVSLVFDWVDVHGITEILPDHHDFVDAFVSPEWGDNPVVMTSFKDTSRIRLFSRSVFGFKPAFVHIVRSNGSVAMLEYQDEMQLIGLPGEDVDLWFEFDIDPININWGGGKG